MSVIALVGQGYMAHTHAASYAALGRAADIAYVCTPRPGAPLEHAPRARFVTDLGVVLQDPAVDVVSVCTPTPTHAGIAVAALEAGKHVLLEKPIALDAADARRIADAAAGSRGVLMVAQVVRFFPGYEAVRRTVESGTLGTLLSVRAKRLSVRPDWAEWWQDEAQSGGVLVDFAIHDFDQMNLLLGRPASVHAVSHGTFGPIETTIVYDGGAVGQVLSHCDLPVGTPFTSGIEVLGTHGMLDYTLIAGSATEGDPHAAGLPGTNIVRTVTATERRVDDVPGTDPYTEQIAYFLDCVATGEPPVRSPVNGAILALDVALAARESVRTGRMVVLGTTQATRSSSGPVPSSAPTSSGE